MDVRGYLAEEVALDHADGMLSRREALRRLALLGLGASAAGSLLSGTAAASPPAAAAGAPSPPPGAAAQLPPVREITFAGPGGRRIMGAYAAAPRARASLLVVHENRGLTDHIRSVASRLAGAGYSSLAIDLLSPEGGTKAVGDEARIMAALAAAPRNRFVADMRAGLGELGRRVPGRKTGAIGFCFGGGQVWSLINSGDRRLVAAAPFYGPAPEQRQLLALTRGGAGRVRGAGHARERFAPSRRGGIGARRPALPRAHLPGRRPRVLQQHRPALQPGRCAPGVRRRAGLVPHASELDPRR